MSRTLACGGWQPGCRHHFGEAVWSSSWLIALLGVVFPSFATFLFAFMTLPDGVDRHWVRLVMLAAAAIIPAIVGLVSLKMMQPGRRPRGAIGVIVTVLEGYPYTVALATTLLMMTAFAPVIRARDLVRGWTSEHVPVIIEARHYLDVLADIQHALDADGLPTARVPESWMLRLPTRVLTVFAGGAVKNLVADRLTVLKGATIELLAHPFDLVISGREADASRARALLAERLTFTKAHMTWDKEANEIEDRASFCAGSRASRAPSAAPLRNQCGGAPRLCGRLRARVVWGPGRAPHVTRT
jgi:hypothetical protein